MVVINAVSYFSNDKERYVVHGLFELPQMVLGDTLEKAVADFENAIKSVMDLAREDSSISLSRNPNLPWEVSKVYDDLILRNKSPDIVRELEGYGALHVYHTGVSSDVEIIDPSQWRSAG